MRRSYEVRKARREKVLRKMAAMRAAKELKRMERADIDPPLRPLDEGEFLGVEGNF